MSNQEEVRQRLKQVMLPRQWFISEELMAATGYDSRLIYKSMRSWRNAGLIRTQLRGETRDKEYRLVR